MKDVIMEFKDIWKTYGLENIKLDALKGISFSLKKNSLNLILGPSGSGKTTLLNIASLMNTPTHGKVILRGNNISSLSKSQRSKIRMKEIGILYQRENLLPYLNILENTNLPMISKDKDKAVELLNNMDIRDHGKFPEELSWEDKQKVALVRAMINHPSLILADEPTGELDEDGTLAIMNLMENIKNKYTILMVSNNSDLANYADNLFYIKNGRLEEFSG